MNKSVIFSLGTLLGAFLGAVAPVVAEAEETKVQQAVEAYLFGYPLVTFDMVRQQNTNVSVSGPEQAPMGQLINRRCVDRCRPNTRHTRRSETFILQRT